jgi:hypothetical protein
MGGVRLCEAVTIEPFEVSRWGGGCGYAMGIESASACNRQNNKELEERGEKRFRTLWPRMMSEVSHAQRPPRQRLSTNGLSGIYRARGPTWIANGVVAVSFNEAKYAAFFSIARQPEPPARSSQSNARFRAIAFAQPNAPDPCGCAPYAREDPEIS